MSSDANYLRIAWYIYQAIQEIISNPFGFKPDGLWADGAYS